MEVKGKYIILIFKIVKPRYKIEPGSQHINTYGNYNHKSFLLFSIFILLDS